MKKAAPIWSGILYPFPMTSICCTIPPPDIKEFLPEEKQRFGFLVHQFRKQGYDLKLAQELAYHQVLDESIPFD